MRDQLLLMNAENAENEAIKGRGIRHHLDAVKMGLAKKVGNRATWQSACTMILASQTKTEH